MNFSGNDTSPLHSVADRGDEKELKIIFRSKFEEWSCRVIDGIMESFQMTARDEDEALYKEAMSAMEDGDLFAQTKVAFYKLTGRGGAEIDVKEAVALLTKCAEAGESEAMWMLGLCNEYGIGVEQDVYQASSLYSLSGDIGNPAGQFLFANDSGGRGSGIMKVSSITNEGIERLDMLMSIAPWTTLDLECLYEMWDNGQVFLNEELLNDREQSRSARNKNAQ